MMRVLAVALVLAAAPAVRAQDPSGGGVLNLSCMEALKAVDVVWLTGVFSFVPESDSALAFADMMARHKAMRRKYVAKLMKDHAQADGIATWDHAVVLHILGIHASPLAAMLEKLDPTTRDRLNTLGLAPTLTLAELNARRKR
ncbi:MAG: hypothetical protein WC943_00950 [Elusimicrobiota bacterium]|jgi:hypothetical protein